MSYSRSEKALYLSVATSEEAEQLISQGFKFVGTLPNGKVVIEKVY